MPSAVLNTEVMDVNNLVCFSFYNATVLAIRPFFSEAVKLFYGVLHTEPLREIHRHFVYAEAVERRKGSEGERGAILKEVVRLIGLCVEIADF